MEQIIRILREGMEVLRWIRSAERTISVLRATIDGSRSTEEWGLARHIGFGILRRRTRNSKMLLVDQLLKPKALEIALEKKA